ncbi:MAG: 7-alpha-hydroxysteroid dehydrogenase [Roseibaca calidilacus]|uniref:7-alpha-hydroxysteroid dehydrogenase n=1 Tax=Roseibaca calidilacus TaxID=1666912 RepID=A0A0P7WJG8_9RHOB|nr:SDR family oxidoreductase [Roseibaca calidilacus]KPP90803.1 MAG: 7-alpha-hydroxysteroid dehydrogenase [Roseibaca calidilacus]CUX83589.1 7-alpha-hydroxysteroid dehydrogenase [Roseibaca calidilacus]
MSFSISGKTAIITGSANGVGLAIARHFTDQGANVVMADRDEGKLKSEVATMSGADEKVIFFAGDLRERLTIANLLSATVDAFDRVDILINATRQCVCSDPLDDQSDTVEEALQQNLLASLKLSQLVAKRMIAQAEDDTDIKTAGSIVNLSSIAARRTQPELMAYSIASAALDQMTRSMAVALAASRVRVNGVALGSVMSANLKDQMQANDGYRDRILHHTPMGRIGAASEAAEAVQFLSSDAAAFMTGQIVTIDGGRTLLDPVSVPAH